VGLRQLAETDLGSILEDDVYGFGFDIIVTDPANVVLAMKGFSNDVSEFIDPDTGQAVSARVASVALRISVLTAGGLGLPTNISDASLKPWRIAFDDINGNSYLFKVSEAKPDRSLGMVVCMLELYQ